MPHTDRIYRVMYPGKDNSTYTDDENRLHRRMNVQVSKYDVLERVNGPFHKKVLEETPE